MKRDLLTWNKDLFEQKGPVTKSQVIYDKHDRSTGIAFITYQYPEDAKEAIRAFNGANALGQPIGVRLVDDTSRINASVTAQSSGRSLFERIENPNQRRNRSRSPHRRQRSRSPPYREELAEDTDDRRRSNVTKAPPGHIDRYIPEGDDRRHTSPRGNPRGDGARRSALPRRGRAHDGGRQINSRPRRTKEELEAELNNDLDSYFNSRAESDSNAHDGGLNGENLQTPGSDVSTNHASDSFGDSNDRGGRSQRNAIRSGNHDPNRTDRDGDVEMG